MYARAHAVSPFSTVPTVGPSSTSYVSSSAAAAATEIVVLKPKASTDNTAALPATSRHRPTTTSNNVGSTLVHQSTVPTSAAFIGEFTFPGEVVGSSSPPPPPFSATILQPSVSTTAAFQKPSAPGTVEEDPPLARVETRTQTQVRPLTRQQQRSNANLIERDSPAEMSYSHRHRQKKSTGSFPPPKTDIKQLAQTYRLSDDVLKSYQEAFRIFDRNNDGCITCQELGTVMKSLGHQPSEAELQDMINEVDVDGSGTIEFDEFVQMMSRRMAEKNEEDGEEELKEAFEVFDRNKDGYITAEELRQVMRSLGENLTDQELNEMMKAADANGDGIINFNEFQEVWTEARHLAMK